ncbi:MAG TPA: biotin--[acetyl-CoA-carboxylase] ligase [Burkholderiaceae bacterium]|nr:biotin--[acetyl-CoA-carboxylase] ligase [Burkholderiaceae bacterium]
MTPQAVAPPEAINWPLEALWLAVAPRVPGLSLECLPSIDSTNSELMRRARGGQLDPLILIAERQTAGRGRLGRSWLTGQAALPPAQLPALTFSYGLPLPRRDLAGLSLAVGVAVAEALRALGCTLARLKWPNDVWLDDTGRKLAGILIETALCDGQLYAIVGVGINLDAPRLASAADTPPTRPRACANACPAPPPPVCWPRWCPLWWKLSRASAKRGLRPFTPASPRSTRSRAARCV